MFYSISQYNQNIMLWKYIENDGFSLISLETSQ